MRTSHAISQTQKIMDFCTTSLPMAIWPSGEVDSILRCQILILQTQAATLQRRLKALQGLRRPFHNTTVALRMPVLQPTPISPNATVIFGD